MSNHWNRSGRLSISVCLHHRARCFSRVCAYFTQSIGLNSEINELKVTGSDTNKVKISNLMIFLYVCKGSLYKITSFCALQTVIVWSRVICTQLLMHAVIVQMLWTWTISRRQQRLCIDFTFHAGSTNVFKNVSISVKNFRNCNSNRLTFWCFCSITALPYYQCAVPHQKKSEHQGKVGMDTFFHLDVLKVSCNAVHFSYHLSYSIFAWSSKTRKKGKEDGKEASLHRFLPNPASLPTQT